MRKIVIISACVVMLAALGFAAWRMYHSNSTEKRSSSPTIPVKCYQVGYDRDGNYITPVSLDPLSRMEFVPKAGENIAKPLIIGDIDSENVTNSGSDLTRNAVSEVFNSSFDDMLKALRLIKRGNLYVIDAEKTTQVDVRLDDKVCVYIKDTKDSPNQKGYLYLINNDEKFRFFIYRAKNPGSKQVIFEHPNGDMKAEPVIVNVTVSK